jgi:signal transduction histidine kinase
VPIIFITANLSSEAETSTAYASGAVDFIFGPIVPEVLRAKVSVFVELHRKTQEARRHAREVEERTRQLEASQQQLRLAERMAALGTLSTGLGHDMGNLLLPIQARLESIDAAVLDPETRDALDGVRACVGHLRRLADGLRLLALDPERGHSAESATEFRAWWNELEPVLKTVLSPGVALEVEAPDGLPPVRIARHLLTQIVFNLVQNAADALRERGSGRVRVSAAVGATPQAVRVEVADDGPGMTDDVRQRCLEPFFTTKLRGISTGLGLSLVNGIIRRAGGELSVASTPGRGCTFRFSLPAANSGTADAPSSREAVVACADRRLRSLAASLVRSSGWRVHDSLAAAGGKARLLLIDGRPEARQTIDEFLTESGAGRVLVMGDRPPALDRRVVSLGATPTPLALSRALQDAMDCVSETAAPAGMTGVAAGA